MTKAPHKLIGCCATCETVFAADENSQIYCPDCETLKCYDCEQTIYKNEAYYINGYAHCSHCKTILEEGRPDDSDAQYEAWVDNLLD